MSFDLSCGWSLKIPPSLLARWTELQIFPRKDSGDRGDMGRGEKGVWGWVWRRVEWTNIMITAGPLIIVWLKIWILSKNYKTANFCLYQVKVVVDTLCADWILFPVYQHKVSTLLLALDNGKRYNGDLTRYMPTTLLTPHLILTNTTYKIFGQYMPQ